MACEMPERLAAVGPEIGSLEAVDGNRCAARCEPESDGIYEMCEWDERAPGCSASEFLQSLPGVFSCHRLKEYPTPMLLFNGNLDPFSNISGLIERPIKPGNASTCTILSAALLIESSLMIAPRNSDRFFHVSIDGDRYYWASHSHGVC